MKDSKFVRLIVALVVVFLLWAMIGALGPQVYWTSYTPIWNEESVVHLGRFLAFRTISFVAVALAIAFIARCVFCGCVRIRTFLVSTALSGFLMAVLILFFVPEWSPIHILYGEIPTTHYQEGFRPRQFLQVKQGMSKSQVEEIVGLGKASHWGPTYEMPTWIYSGAGGSNHWRYRLHFNDEGILADIVVKYWWD